MQTKVCRKCRQSKSYLEFCAAKKSRDGLASWCKECTNRRRRELRIGTKSNRLADYGISDVEFDLKLKLQNGKCPLCDSEINQSSPVDHCHKTGRVRAILCKRCNLRLGHFNDDPMLLRKAADYLEKYQ